jgi:hypothetical protein
MNNKTLIRSYATAEEGDLVVFAFEKDGRRSDLSKSYEDVPRNRHKIQPDAYLDVFRYDDGDITWSGTPNGNDPSGASSFKLLLDAFTQDLALPEGNVRAF